MNVDVGAKLRTIRKMHGLSQRELAKRAGVTNGMISLIEQNRTSPSVSSLRKVLAGIPMTIGDFFTLDFESDAAIFYDADDLPDLGSADVHLRLVGHKRKDRKMSILHEIYPPGADTGPEMLSHDGEEGGVVVEGEIEVSVGTRQRVLSPGDAYYFESRLPHRFRNIGDRRCVIISANTPPTF